VDDALDSRQQSTALLAVPSAVLLFIQSFTHIEGGTCCTRFDVALPARRLHYTCRVCEVDRMNSSWVARRPHTHRLTEILCLIAPRLENVTIYIYIYIEILMLVDSCGALPSWHSDIKYFPEREYVHLKISFSIFYFQIMRSCCGHPLNHSCMQSVCEENEFFVSIPTTAYISSDFIMPHKDNYNRCTLYPKNRIHFEFNSERNWPIHCNKQCML